MILIAGGIAYFVFYLPASEPTSVAVNQEPAPQPEPKPVYYSPLTGVEVDNSEATSQTTTAIIIENSPDARPQSGLKNSGVVFEAIAEGGITRFLVIYQEQKPQLIGPVRSLRPYYVDWLAAFDASVVHVGGSANALTEIENGSYRNIDQRFGINTAYFWRATDRYAPHNVYTSFANLDEVNQARGYTSSTFTGFSRTNSEANPSPTATSIAMVISSPGFNVNYNYNAATNTYDRLVGGAAHVDREDGQISPRVVVGMLVEQSTIFEDGYRESINSIGTGTAYIFQDGVVSEVTWNKPSKTAQLTFSDSAGNDVPLARGQTWITAIPANKGGSVTWQ